jgi:hypothetical protein
MGKNYKENLTWLSFELVQRGGIVVMVEVVLVVVFVVMVIVWAFFNLIKFCCSRHR